ncbi:MAG: ATP-dependent DNA helicase [Eubacteriales bacterium]|nr:ATP-dependent DNA helicase [Eubacteriales bacterium]
MDMKAEDRQIRISVRSLVEFLLRSGSLEPQAGASSEAVMLEGSRLHRLLQKKAGAGYRAEVPLRMEIPLGAYLRETAKWSMPLRFRSAPDACLREPELSGFCEATSQKDIDLTAGDRESSGGMLLLEGRADGIFCAGKDARKETGSQEDAVGSGYDCLEENGGGLWMIDEIKTIRGSVQSIQAPAEVHLAQARCYAYMYASAEKLDRIGVRMTYCSQETEAVRYFREELEFASLENWFKELIAAYVPWARLRLAFSLEARDTLRQMDFPFPYRKGQFELAAGVYRTVARGRKLYLQAPTGTGKTMAVLFPSLKAVGEGKADRVWYLTAKAVTGRVAVEALEILRERGLRIRSVVLGSKERTCPFEIVDCRPAACTRADGHYDRVNEALWALLQGAEEGVPLTMSRVAACAEKYSVCPYELAMDAADFADVIVGDYNYAFHPQARLDSLLEGRRAILLADEAHNLLERGREMYSADLSYREVRLFRRSVKSVLPRLWKRLGELSSALRGLDKRTREMVPEEESSRPCVLQEWEDDREKLRRALETVGNEIQWILEQENRSTVLYGGAGLEESSSRQELLEFYFHLIRFARTLENVDGRYIVYTTGRGSGPAAGFCIHLFCADPSGRLRECMEKTVSAIFFSATFLPIQYYKSLLGGTPEDYEMYARSSFSPAQLKVVIAADVTSRYRDRNEGNFLRIAERIGWIAGCRPGNYMVYFPSYAFLEKVLEAFDRLCGGGNPSQPEDGQKGGGEISPPEEESEKGLERLYRNPAFSALPIRILAQERKMEDAERAAFLQAFEETEPDRHLVGFCVLGGMFGEGIDLREDRLIGSIIVGTGIPPVEPKRELLRAYFSREGRKGYDYAYRYPGMNKVLQAAGRVIRTEMDAGIVALLDSRFADGSNQELFPVEWERPAVEDGAGALARVRSFWEERNAEAGEKSRESME